MDGGVGAAGRRWCWGGVEGGGATVVSGRRRGRRGDGGVGAGSRAAGRRWCRGGGATVASRAAGRRWCRGGATVASGEEIGEGDHGRGRGRERGSRYEVGAHNTNGAPPLGAP